MSTYSWPVSMGRLILSHSEQGTLTLKLHGKEGIQNIEKANIRYENLITTAPFFHPVVKRCSDGSFSVVFNPRGLGGGGICCKEEQEEKQPLFQQPLLQEHPPLPSAPSYQPPPLRNVQVNLAQIEERLSEMKREIIEESTGNLSTYVPVVAQSYEQMNDLSEEVDRFSESQQIVFLVMGDAGTGKSLFFEFLASKFWKSYQSGSKIPLLIPLPDIMNLDRCIEETLEKRGFSEDEIAYLKRNREFIVFFDGYDEIATDRNLFVSNRLHEWSAKVLISCRSQYLPGNYQDLFIPYVAKRPRPGLFRERTIAPFSPAQINHYLEIKIAQGNTPWENWRACRSCIDSIPGLSFLVQNPFVLGIVVQTLPDVLQKYAHLDQEGSYRLTRRELYRLFVQGWFNRQQEKLVQGRRIPSDCDMRPQFFEFSKRLAHKMQQAGLYSVHYDEGHALFEDRTIEWQPFFGQNDPQLELIRSGCPLRKTGTLWRFIHGTVEEFFFSEKLFEAMGHLDTQIGEEKRAAILRVLPNLNEKNLIDQHLVLQFLADRVHAERGFREALFEIIHLSSKDPNIATAASNAATILNRAEVPFSRLTFQNANIPDADFSRGILDGTKFLHCNLQRVRLVNAFMKDTVFTGSQMQEVVLGQKPFLSFGRPQNFALSSRWIATYDTSKGRKVEIYDRNTLKHVHNLPTPFHSIGMIEFSPKGEFLVVSSSDSHSEYQTFPTLAFRTDNWTSVSLGNAEGTYPTKSFFFRTPIHILSDTYKKGKTKLFTESKGYYFWNIKTRNKESLFSDFKTGKLAVSSNGQCIAYSTEKQTIIVRNSANRTTVETPKIECRHSPKEFVLSPNGTTLIYLAKETHFLFNAPPQKKGLIFFDVLSGKIVKRIHSFPGTSMLTLSPNGEELAAQCEGQITIWNLFQEKEIARIPGHTGFIKKIQFSEDGRFIYSSSEDCTLRVREVSYFKKSPGVEQVWMNNTSASSGAKIIGGIDIETSRKIQFWRMETREVETAVTLASINSSFESFHLFPSGKKFAIDEHFEGASTLIVWDIATKSILKKILISKKYTNSAGVSTSFPGNALAISQDERYLAATITTNEEPSVQVWDIEADALKHDIRHPSTKEKELPWRLIARDLAFSPDGNLLAMALASGVSQIKHKMFQIYDLKIGVPIKIFEDHAGVILFSPDGKYFIFSNEQHQIFFHHLESDQNEFVLQAHQEEITALAIAPDGNLLASADRRGDIILYNLTKRRPVARFAAHLERITKLWFDETGEKLVSTGYDHIIRKWDLYDSENQLDPRLCWASNRSFYARGVVLGKTIGLSPDDEAALQQVDKS